MPLWVQMQYGYCMATGRTAPPRLDNDRYPGIEWTSVDGVVRKAFDEAEASKAGQGSARA
jgi:hypothetical protein